MELVLHNTGTDIQAKDNQLINQISLGLATKKLKLNFSHLDVRTTTLLLLHFYTFSDALYIFFVYYEYDEQSELSDNKSTGTKSSSYFIWGHIFLTTLILTYATVYGLKRTRVFMYAVDQTQKVINYIYIHTYNYILADIKYICMQLCYLFVRNFYNLLPSLKLKRY